MQQYKCARVSALTGSPAQWHAKWPRGCSQPLLYSNPCRQSYYISPSPLSQQIVSISLSKEYFTLCMISRPWTDFCVQYCCSQIDQIEYQGQIRNTRILESKPLIDTYYCIRHRLELEIFSLRTISAQSSSSSSWTGRRFRSGLCTGFDSEHAAMSYFIPREQWTIERLSEVMGAALVSYLSPIEPNSIENFISHEKKKKLLVAARNLQFTNHQILFDSRTESVCSRRPTPTNCTGAGPQELGHLFCSQNFRLPSGLDFGSDYQMIGWGSNLDSNLNSAAWPTGWKGFICPQVPE